MKTVLTAKLVETKLRKFNGNLAAVGRALGVTRQAVHDFMQRRPTLLAVYAECRESMKDHAESSLHKAIRKGAAWAVCFYLKCQAKDRGYVERVQVQEIPEDDLNSTIENELARLAGRGSAKDAGARPGANGTA